MFVAKTASTHARSTPETGRNTHHGSKCTSSSKSWSGTDSIRRRSRTRSAVRKRNRSGRKGASRTIGRPSEKFTTTNGTRHLRSTNGNTWEAARSESAKTMRRSTSPRCRTRPSIGIVFLVEGGKPTFPGCAARTPHLRCLLQEMLHRMARLRFVEEERRFPFVEAELRGQVDPQLLVALEQGSDRGQELAADQRLRDVQGQGQLLRERIARAPLGTGPRHLDQVVRELKLAPAGAPLAGHGDAARHHLARVRPEAVPLPASRPPEVDVRSAQGLVPAHQVVGSREFMAEILVDPEDQVLRGFVELPYRIAGPPRVAGAQDLLQDREDRPRAIPVAQGPRGLREDGPFAERERLEIVDRGPQVSAGPFDDQLAASLPGTNELARFGKGLQDGPARRNSTDRLRVAAVRGIHLDHAPSHLVPEGECGTRLADAGIALEDDRALVRSTLVPGRGPLSEFRDGRGIPDDLVEGLGSVLLCPAGHRFHR